MPQKRIHKQLEFLINYIKKKKQFMKTPAQMSRSPAFPEHMALKGGGDDVCGGSVPTRCLSESGSKPSFQP